MKKLHLKAALIAGTTIAMMMTGCGQPGPKATRGALAGGAGAAGVTALVGGSSTSIVTAAAVGAVAGGLYGDSKDKK